MNKKTLKIIGISTCLFFGLFMLSSWGMWGHQRINKAAIFALPTSELQVFFYNHLDFITEESTVPDLRKYTLNDRAEHPRHFIDIEDYNMAIDSLPRSTAEANTLYDTKTLQSRGILPWYIQDVMNKLTKAMRDKRKTEILFLAADLGHYIADAHMPLHTSNNHNGQLTNQNGIHSLWEAQLPELLGKNFNLYIDNAHYVENITTETWAIIKHSNYLADTLLRLDAGVRKEFTIDEILQKDEQGKIIKNKFNQVVFTEAYTNAFNQRINGMVENQLRGAITETASYWYTAWVNAGKPALSNLDDKGLSDRNRNFMASDIELWEKTGKLNNLKSESEF